MMLQDKQEVDEEAAPCENFSPFALLSDSDDSSVFNMDIKSAQTTSLNPRKTKKELQPLFLGLWS